MVDRQKNKYYINRDTFLKLGINPNEAVRYLESKEAAEIHPCHVKAVQILKHWPVVASSLLFSL